MVYRKNLTLIYLESINRKQILQPCRVKES